MLAQERLAALEWEPDLRGEGRAWIWLGNSKYLEQRFSPEIGDF